MRYDDVYVTEACTNFLLLLQTADLTGSLGGPKPLELGLSHASASEEERFFTQHLGSPLG